RAGRRRRRDGGVRLRSRQLARVPPRRAHVRAGRRRVRRGAPRRNLLRRRRRGSARLQRRRRPLPPAAGAQRRGRDPGLRVLHERLPDGAGTRLVGAVHLRQAGQRAGTSRRGPGPVARLSGALGRWDYRWATNFRTTARSSSPSPASTSSRYASRTWGSRTVDASVSSATSLAKPRSLSMYAAISPRSYSLAMSLSFFHSTSVEPAQP